MQSTNPDATDARVLRHLRVGWWSILIFLTLGFALELLHAFKIGWYLDVDNATRRLMWTLAHAHGTLLGLIHVGYAATLRRLGPAAPKAVASLCLTGATVLLPGGFFLGGLVVYGGDPGLGALLVPVGAVLLLVPVFQVAWALSRSPQRD